MRFKKDQAVQATAYYFHHYACHWASPAVAAGYRSIPQVRPVAAAAAAAAVVFHTCVLLACVLGVPSPSAPHPHPGLLALCFTPQRRTNFLP
jgi:hypothetical protein